MMILPRKEDAIHKAWLCRILERIADDPALSESLYFKGGTCASMLGWLDRFSVDLDFDYVGDENAVPTVRARLEELWDTLGLSVKDTSKKWNTIKIDTSFPVPRANTYAPMRFAEIDRILTCQTKDTMVANKLIALFDRKRLAGRDVYDVHYFLMHGFPYNRAVIEERFGGDVGGFFSDLGTFVEKNVTDQLLAEDLNCLLPYEKFRRIRRVLKREMLMFLRDELARLEQGAQR